MGRGFGITGCHRRFLGFKFAQLHGARITGTGKTRRRSSLEKRLAGGRGWGEVKAICFAPEVFKVHLRFLSGIRYND